MSVADLIRQPGPSAAPLSPQQLVARYQRLRAVCKNLNSAMVQRLARDALHEGGRKLGILQGNTFVFSNEGDTSVLMDYCLYHVRRNGRTAVEQYCCDHPPVAGTDEATCLRAMQAAIYSLFRVDATEPGVALAVTDLATDEQYLLVDIGLSETAKPGVVFLSRLLLFGDFAATGGAAIPLGWLPKEKLASFCDGWKRVWDVGPANYDPAPLIRDCLRQGVTDHTQYLDAPSSPLRQPQMARVPRKQRAALLKLSGKSDPTRRCPCGSGKMFKNCCMKKSR